MRRLLLLAVALALPVAAHADDAANGRRFGPTPVLSPYLTLDGTHTQGDGGLGFHALGSYERRPLIFERDGERTLDIVGDRWALDLALTYGFLPRLDFGLNVPLILEQAGAGADGTGVTSSALGDPALALKFELVDKNRNAVGLAVIGQASLPLGDEEALVGEPGSTLGGRLALEIPSGSRLDAVVNAGYRARQGTRVEDLPLNDELTFGLGLSARLLPRLQVLGELTANTPASEPFAELAASPADANGGIRVRIYEGLHLVLGGGAGLVPGYGAPAWRGFVGLESAPRRHDYDADQVADGDDDCVDVPGLIAERGCPAREVIAAKPGPRKPADDQDEDGVKDNQDRCPFLAEDQDRFQDLDGCPDPDNDLDILADAYDGDPMTPEDWDGFEDDDGIADTDNDRDNVADLDDRCPDEPAETENGCPGGKAVAREASAHGLSGTVTGPAPVEGGPLLLGDTLHPAQPLIFEFADTALTPSSEPHVDGLAEFVKAHPELGTFEVGVHVDSVGNRNWKVWLSQARAEALVRELARRGVPEERLVPHGYGFDVPVADNASPQGRALNRRVELRRLEGAVANPTRGRARRAPVASPEGERGPVLRPESPIRFVNRSAELHPDSEEEIRALAEKLRAHPEWKRIEVGVYTDGRGSHAAKWRLSQERAEVVREALVEAGVAEHRLVARGFGAAVPIAPDDTAEGRAANRRVELTVLRPARRPAGGGHGHGQPDAHADHDGSLSRGDDAGGGHGGGHGGGPAHGGHEE